VRGRAKAHVPDDARHEPKWQLVLGMLDELREWDLRPPVPCGAGAYGDITELRLGPGGAIDPLRALRQERHVGAARGSAARATELSGHRSPATARYRRH